MIQIPEDIAWVRETGGRARPFDGARLAASLERSIMLLGTATPDLIEAIVEVVHLYICDCCPDRTIDGAEIAELIGDMFSMLGLDDLSRAYERRGQWTRIRLDHMAADENFELGFYQRLDTQLQAVADAELELVQLFGLRACVMRLRGAHRWGTSCRMLADEIIGFVRGRVQRVRPDHASALNVEVME